jgi:hypothetical protein
MISVVTASREVEFGVPNLSNELPGWRRQAPQASQ